MKRSLSTLFLIALLLALIIGCAKLGAPVGVVEENKTPVTAAIDSKGGILDDIEIKSRAANLEGYDKEYYTEADLDGDGTAEEIILRTVTNLNGDEVTSYELSIEEEMVSYQGEMISPNFHLTDLLSTDHLFEIAVSEEGPSSDYATVFYRYMDGSLSVLGKLQGFLGNIPNSDMTGKLVVHGDGRVTTLTRGEVMQTFFYEDEYVLISPTELRHVEKDLYPMETEVTLLKPLKTLLSRTDQTPAYEFQPGERATLLNTDNHSWVSIQNKEGRVSWFRIRDFGMIFGQEEEGFSTDFFDGLNMAD